MTKDDLSDKENDRLERLANLLQGDEADDYSVVAGRMAEARTLLHEIIADRLAKPLNNELARRPQKTLQEKQELSRWVNRELRALGVAIECPNTHQPGVLAADPGYRPDEGRFQIGLIETDGYRRKTFSSTSLFPLNLTTHPNRQEPKGEYWVRKSSRNPGDEKDRM